MKKNSVKDKQQATDYLKVLQISDLHLFADLNACLLGVNTRESFLAVLEQIKTTEVENGQQSPDLILVTGDISQDYSVESYQFFAQQMAQLGCPVICVAGNHDQQSHIEQFLNQPPLSLQKDLKLGTWQFLVLPSQIQGLVHGEISQAELSWLDKQLASSDDVHSIVMTHHHPVAVGSAWIDRLDIFNKQELNEVLARHQNAKALIFGHVHQDFSLHQQGTDYYSVPATCIQFKPNSQEFAVSDELPGYRLFRCYPDGNFETEVVRVEAFDLTLDLEANGY